MTGREARLQDEHLGGVAGGGRGQAPAQAADKNVRVQHGCRGQLRIATFVREAASAPFIKRVRYSTRTRLTAGQDDRPCLSPARELGRGV